MHTHIIYDAILKLNIRIFLSNFLGSREEQAIGEPHNIGFVNRGDFAVTVSTSIFKSKLDNTTGCHHRDKLDAHSGIVVETGTGGLSNCLDDLFVFGRSSLEFDAGI